jgi:hypothetical protein
VRQEEITAPLTATMLAAMTPSDFRARGCGQLRLAQPVQAERWRGEYGFGYCFYRVGPGFIHLVDVRDADDAARLLLDDPATVEAFSQLAGVVRLSELPPLAAELADQLDRARLLLRLGDWATILPWRLHRWPISCTAV